MALTGAELKINWENWKILLNNNAEYFSCLKCPANNTLRLFLAFHVVVFEKFSVSVFVLCE